MFALSKLPQSVSDYFVSKGLSMDGAVFVMRTDLGNDCVPKSVYIVLTSKMFAAAEGSIVVESRAGGRFEPSDYREYPIDELSDFRSEQQISSGFVTATHNGRELVLFNYSNTYMHESNIFVRVAGELKEKGGIDEQKAKEDMAQDKFCPKCHERYPDPDRRICPRCMDKSRLIKRLLSFFAKYKQYVLIILLTFAFSAGLTVLAPYVSNAVFYDEVLDPAGSMYGMIFTVIAMIAGVRIVSMLVEMTNLIISAKVAARVVYDLKKTIFGSIQRLSLGFFTNRQTGGLMTQVNSDATTIYWFFCDGFPYLITCVLQLTVVIIVMLSVNPTLTLYTFVTVPLFFLSYRLVFRMFSKLHARAYSRRRSFNSLISDVLTGVRVVKSFSREDEELARFGKSNRRLAQADINVGVTSYKIFPAISFMLNIGTFLVWGIGGWQVVKGDGMTYGTLMQFVACMTLVYSPLGFLADVSNWWADCLNAMQRLFEIADTVPQVRESEHPVHLDSVRGDVEFCNVKFSYEENKPVINDVSFSVPAGGTVGIVGHTGAGKSTLANLLTRLYDPSDGCVKIDGTDLRELSFDQLRGTIAIVSQETYLFRGTILENIRYARPDASFEEVVRAAKAASAHEFIIKYPEGYQTQVGWGYKELSGGERQRVSIARAVLCDPKILILDEATAAMDTQTERSIQASLDRLTKGRTTIVIAHRLSTLRDADFLIVIENGKVAESGTARELLARDGVYRKLYRLQTEALKTIGVEE